MPELPEVEHGRRQLQAVLVGRRIESVEVRADEIVFEGRSVAEVDAALRGAEVLGAGRRGKHLWLELDRRPWPLFHFGMTGGFVVRGADGLQLATGPTQDSAWPPRFTKLVMVADDGGRIAMTNARRLGRVRLRERPLQESPLAELGFDPLLQTPDADAIMARLRRRRVTMKGLLLDQGFAAGVGNWIADDVLLAAGIAPQRAANTLTADEASRLADALTSIVRTAVAADAHSDRFPRGWLFHQRWRPAPGLVTPEGDPIVFTKVAGRTTAWVPARQR